MRKGKVGQPYAIFKRGSTIFKNNIILILDIPTRALVFTFCAEKTLNIISKLNQTI